MLEDGWRDPRGHTVTQALAAHHATGIRVRDMPLTADKLVAHPS